MMCTQLILGSTRLRQDRRSLTSSLTAASHEQIILDVAAFRPSTVRVLSTSRGVISLFRWLLATSSAIFSQNLKSQIPTNTQTTKTTMTRYLFLASLLFLAPLLSTAQLEETKPCIDFSNPLAVASAAKTTSSCKNNGCGGGCCRYHTAFLTCDTKNNFPHQACICNDLTV
jgi:hypothetical protein